MQNASKKPPVDTFECNSDSEQDCKLEWATFVAETKKEWANQAPGRMKRFVRYFYDRFLRLHGSVNQIAWGTALGLFVAMSPTMGFQMAISIPVAAFFKISKLASAIAVWVTNPATAPFIYWMNYKIGAKLLGYPAKAKFLADPSWNALVKSGTHTILCLTVGGVITGLIVAIPGFFITQSMVKAARVKAARLKEKKRKKKEEKKAKARVL